MAPLLSLCPLEFGPRRLQNHHPNTLVVQATGTWELDDGGRIGRPFAVSLRSDRCGCTVWMAALEDGDWPATDGGLDSTLAEFPEAI